MLILFNKPYGVICQFSPADGKPTLKEYIDVPNVYPAGRLDTDSEGLLMLTDDGALQHQIADPAHKMTKTYWAEVEGLATEHNIRPLRTGVDLGDFVTKPAVVRIMSAPPSAEQLWPRTPPVRFRKNIPTSWLEIEISEGKNRQVRRMTAKVLLPTLRLVRVAVGPWRVDGLAPGRWRISDPVEQRNQK
jgi:23S rRNA pseudouridine2457 synthase